MGSHPLPRKRFPNGSGPLCCVCARPTLVVSSVHGSGRYAPLSACSLVLGLCCLPRVYKRPLMCVCYLAPVELGSQSEPHLRDEAWEGLSAQRISVAGGHRVRRGAVFRDLLPPFRRPIAWRPRECTHYLSACEKGKGAYELMFLHAQLQCMQCTWLELPWPWRRLSWLLLLERVLQLCQFGQYILEVMQKTFFLIRWGNSPPICAWS